MQRPALSLSRVRASLLLLIVGAALVITAFVRAGDIPRAAHHDFGVLIRSLGGTA